MFPFQSFGFIPLVPDLMVFLPAVTYGWGYWKGSKRKKLGRGL